jgi:hypothetical protein
MKIAHAAYHQKPSRTAPGLFSCPELVEGFYPQSISMIEKKEFLK